VRSFRQFPAGSSTITAPQTNYYYAVQCQPVIDPTMKFLREPVYARPVNSANVSEGFVTMWRITVTVRGPLATVAEAQDAVFGLQNSLQQKGAVEAQLATYIANKALGEAWLALPQYATASEGASPNPSQENNFYLWIRNSVESGSTYPYAENFTVFE